MKLDVHALLAIATRKVTEFFLLLFMQKNVCLLFRLNMIYLIAVRILRRILHCDLNNFFASVEQVRNPELKNVPMAVCGDPNKRHGIILAKIILPKIWYLHSRTCDIS